MNSSSTIESNFVTSSEVADGRQVEVFQGKDGLIAIREDWDRITHQLNNLHFFQRYEWYESYLDHLAEADSSVYFILVRQQKLPAAIIPLMQATRRVGGLNFRSLELIHHPHMPFSDGVFAPSESNRNIIAELIQYLRARSDLKWDLMVFPNLLEGGSIRHALNVAPPAWLISAPPKRSNYLECTSYDDLLKTISKNFRRNLQKARNKLTQLNGVEYICARQQPQLDQAFVEFLDVE